MGEDGGYDGSRWDDDGEGGDGGYGVGYFVGRKGEGDDGGLVLEDRKGERCEGGYVEGERYGGEVGERGE